MASFQGADMSASAYCFIAVAFKFFACGCFVFTAKVCLSSVSF